MAEESYISPKEGALTPELIKDALENPEGLTKEGAEYSLKQWQNSSNQYMKNKYLFMIERCKNFATSGKTVEGKTILSRTPTGTPRWAENI